MYGIFTIYIQIPTKWCFFHGKCRQIYANRPMDGNRGNRHQEPGASERESTSEAGSWDP